MKTAVISEIQMSYKTGLIRLSAFVNPIQCFFEIDFNCNQTTQGLCSLKSEIV